MRQRHRVMAGLLGSLLAACSPAAPDKDAAVNVTEGVTPDPTLRPVAVQPPSTTGQWTAQPDGAALAFATDAAHSSLQLRCDSGSGVLIATLPGVRAIGSEERLSFGGGGDVVALVATPAQVSRNDISGRGPVPKRLEAMLRAGPGASYGATAIGPLPPVEAQAARRFAKNCAPSPAATRSACHVQDEKPLAIEPRRAVGTEPFWSAAIDGRCVTYSTPEQPAGVRIWTHVAGGARPSFAGALDGKPFRLDLSPAKCSDGMSDREYEWSATLVVRGETRRGCVMETGAN